MPRTSRLWSDSGAKRERHPLWIIHTSAPSTTWENTKGALLFFAMMKLEGGDYRRARQLRESMESDGGVAGDLLTFLIDSALEPGTSPEPSDALNAFAVLGDVALMIAMGFAISNRPARAMDHLKRPPVPLMNLPWIDRTPLLDPIRQTAEFQQYRAELGTRRATALQHLSGISLKR